MENFDINDFVVDQNLEIFLPGLLGQEIIDELLESARREGLFDLFLPERTLKIKKRRSKRKKSKRKIVDCNIVRKPIIFSTDSESE